MDVTTIMAMTMVHVITAINIMDSLTEKMEEIALTKKGAMRVKK